MHMNSFEKPFIISSLGACFELFGKSVYSDAPACVDVRRALLERNALLCTESISTCAWLASSGGYHNELSCLSAGGYKAITNMQTEGWLLMASSSKENV